MRGLRSRAPRRGFTLVEILVVILIILLVSAVTLPTVISAYNHREVSEAARILQGGLVGARDTAINNNAPAGIRLLPDPNFNGINPATGVLDPRLILAANRYVPIQLAPDYSEGLVRVDGGPPLAAYTIPNPNAYFNYPASKGGGFYPAGTSAMLYLEQEAGDPGTGVMNPPTSWYWNIRIGDKVQVNNTGIWYTVVGPMNVQNPEGFVNVGPPGTTPPLVRVLNGITYHPEILFLVNGIDDDKDGYIDNGFDGINNNGDPLGLIDELSPPNATNEWVEIEAWQPSLVSGSVNVTNLPYTITRRPVVAPGARETYLPGNVVVDLTFAHGFPGERSRLPVDDTTGAVDVLLYPNGQVVPSTAYSSFSLFGMDSAFYHFWLAERTDLYPINVNPNTGATLPRLNSPPNPFFLLPMPYGAFAQATPFAALTPNAYDALVANNPTLPVLKGEIRILSLNARTGQVITSSSPPFNVNNVNQPFFQPQQGVRGGQ
jgi:prepilin-type N-terminal cleavage/methylation domain-containing protein